jgi:hypothetical protein
VGALVLGTIVGLRFYRGSKEFKVFFGAFMGAIAFYALGFQILPPDLGFIPAACTETSPAIDFANGLLILSLVFHGFWSFGYFVCVSPSMSVLIALRRRGRVGFNRDEAMALQGGPEQDNLLFRRRLPKLVQGGYVDQKGSGYQLLERGARVAAIGLLLKRVINSQDGV